MSEVNYKKIKNSISFFSFSFFGWGEGPPFTYFNKWLWSKDNNNNNSNNNKASAKPMGSGQL